MQYLYTKDILDIYLLKASEVKTLEKNLKSLFASFSHIQDMNSKNKQGETVFCTQSYTDRQILWSKWTQI